MDLDLSRLTDNCWSVRSHPRWNSSLLNTQSHCLPFIMTNHLTSNKYTRTSYTYRSLQLSWSDEYVQHYKNKTTKSVLLWISRSCSKGLKNPKAVDAMLINDLMSACPTKSTMNVHSWYTAAFQLKFSLGVGTARHQPLTFRIYNTLWWFEVLLWIVLIFWPEVYDSTHIPTSSMRKLYTSFSSPLTVSESFPHHLWYNTNCTENDWLHIMPRYTTTGPHSVNFRKYKEWLFYRRSKTLIIPLQLQLPVLS